MARPLRIEFPNAVYYLATEGNGGEIIFRDDADRSLFLDTLAQACARLRWQVLAFRLDPCRLELVVCTAEPNLVLGMKWLLGTFTIKFNRRHQRRGHLLAGRYRSVLIEPSAPYLPAAVDFVHLALARSDAPVRPSADDVWCSYGYYLKPSSRRPPWLSVQPVFHCLQLADDETGRAQWTARLRSAADAPRNEEWKPLRRGWRMGGETFRRELLKRLSDTRGNSAEPGRVFVREQAELMVREELARLGWTEEDLAQRPKGDPEKVRIARRLRAETTASLRWVAARLHMGAWTSAANSLYRKDSTPAPQPRRPGRRPKKTPPPAVAASKPESAETTASPATPPEDLPVHCL